ncbi:hypothetical protein D0T12_21930 [Actinomadura spongiicola]|uniref:MFS transporter n=1 Tax=Actinomadura spongiicola TaxID=2303421 RepID=A0A372GE80_9ACTN|nr:hypothetical protein [Actinomadura spongiicola]RFS83676.1 hypothetical protein D0T12_21930 [Actinomadura spongiicola]
MGGVFGIAVVSGVFAEQAGVGGGGDAFVAGSRPVLWAATAILALAVVAATLTPSSSLHRPAEPLPGSAQAA